MHSDGRCKELKQTNKQIKNSKASLSHWDTKIQPQLDLTFQSEEYLWGCQRECPCSEDTDAEIYIQVQHGICNLFPDGSAIIIIIIIMYGCGVAGGERRRRREKHKCGKM